MKNETKQFPLRVLLTVTTGRLLTKSVSPNDNGIGDLHNILEWMTNDSIWTHQLPRFGDECKPWLLRWFPNLALAATDESLTALDKVIEARGAEEGVEAWLRTIQPRLNLKYDVPRIPQDDHEHKDPYDEIVQMRGTDEGITILELPATEGKRPA